MRRAGSSLRRRVRRPARAGRRRYELSARGVASGDPIPRSAERGWGARAVGGTPGAARLGPV